MTAIGMPPRNGNRDSSAVAVFAISAADWE